MTHRATTAVLEVLADGAAAGRASGTFAEVLLDGAASARVSGLYLEALVSVAERAAGTPPPFQLRRLRATGRLV